MSEWNWSAERRTAIGDVANQSLEYVAERLLESRKRAFDAEHKAQQLQTELDALKTAHVWIKTSERMPPRGSVVLVLFDNGHIGTGQCIVVGDPTGPAYRWYLSASGSIELTEYAVAWMPLPEAPK